METVTLTLVLFAVLLILPGTASCWSIGDCNDLRIKFLKDGNHTLFPTYLVDNQTLSFQGCRALCENPINPLPRVSSDCGSRLFTWLLPGVVLVVALASPYSNLAFRLWAAIHPLSDPVDTAMSLAFRFLWLRWCYLEAMPLTGPSSERNLDSESVQAVVEPLAANIIDKGAIDTVRDDSAQCEAMSEPALEAVTVPLPEIAIGSSLPTTNNTEEQKTSTHTFKTISAWTFGHMSTAYSVKCQRARAVEIDALTYLRPDLTPEECANLLRDTPFVRQRAQLIRHAKDGDMLKAVSTVIVSLGGLVVAAIPAAGGSRPSGILIAAAMVLSFLFLSVLLTNSLGEHGSPLVLRSFFSSSGICLGCEEETGSVNWHDKNDTNSLKFLASHNGIACYQPRKFMILRANWYQISSKNLRWRFVIVSILLLGAWTASLIVACVAMAAPPVNFHARHLVLLGLLAAWLVSFAVTTLVNVTADITASRANNSHWAQSVRFWSWLAVAFKDLGVAITVPVLFGLITCGWLSDCRMWSGCWNCPESQMKINTNPQADFNYNSYDLFPRLVGIGLAANGGVLVLIAILERLVFQFV